MAIRSDDLLTVGYRWTLRGCLTVATWATSQTVLPSWTTDVVALGLAVGVAVAIGALLEAIGIDQGGRCRARTNDGSRCSHPRRPGEDLCRQVHQQVADVDLVDDVVKERQSETE